MNRSVRSMVLAALMTALICLFSQIAVPVGMANMTMQTFIVALAGYVLGVREALMTVGAYLLLGGCGLPVFSGFAGGIGILLGPTGGFLIGFPGMASVCAHFNGKGCGVRRCAGFAGLAAVYAAGAAWMAVSAGMSFGGAVMAGVVPFVWKDVLSILGAEWLGRKMRRRGIGR